MIPPLSRYWKQFMGGTAVAKAKSTWREHLHLCGPEGTALFDGDFLDRWGDRPWAPNAADATAAGLFHIELISRIVTQRLDYADGVEASALKSVYDLFGRARTICENNVHAVHFEPMVWHVLNRHVRPFTAKWHRRSSSPAFSALDATDEFRAELDALRPLLRQFDELMLELRDGAPPPRWTPGEDDSPLIEEMMRGFAFGIDTGPNAKEIKDAELAAITARRGHYSEFYEGREPDRNAAGMALSGGGIRSATFSLGVLVSLARRNLLPQIDYLSTVSGGGYLGAFLSTYLEGPAATTDDPAQQAAAGAAPPIGLRSSELPFCATDREATAIGHIRQNSRYLLSGSLWSRLQIAFAQIYGLMVNTIATAAFVGAFVIFEILARRCFPWDFDPGQALFVSGAVLLVAALLLLIAMRIAPRASGWTDPLFALSALPLLAVMLVLGLDRLHSGLEPYLSRYDVMAPLLLAPIVLAGLAIVAGRATGRFRTFFRLVAGLSMPLFLLVLYLSFYAMIERLSLAGISLWLPAGGIALLLVLLAWALDVNFTGLHRHYRAKLAAVFLVQQSAGGTVSETPLKLSALTGKAAAPYPLINAALNVPSSNRPDMQGRLTDFFLFTPHYCGSPILGYRETRLWETENKDLDVGTAMAISGAAASPQMGLNSPGRLSFWLALINVRLGYWLAQPGKRPRIPGFGRPGLPCLLREMFGRMDEGGRHVNLSDGGHIENLGVYELLRRRCKYIIAIDGEQDARMTFGALTTLQRMAAIDLGVKIDIDLEDLRINDKGFSRSHFRFARIRYRDGDIGYLLYLKLSLTGNEGEFLRRYKLDEPDFPHHSTLDQLFTEPQFEAYRSLGEHVGDKLFLKAIIGDLADQPDHLDLEQWFAAIGRSFLEPEPPPAAARS